MSPWGTSYDHYRSHHRLEGATAPPRVSLRPPLLLHRCGCRKGGPRALERLAELCDVSCVMTVGHDRVVARRGGGLLIFFVFLGRSSPSVDGNRQSCASNEDTPPRRREVSTPTLSVQDCATSCTGSAASVEAAAHLLC